MICPSFNIHGLKSQVPNQASRSTKVIEPRTYFKLVNRLRFWGFYTKPCCVFSDLRMAKCRRSQPGVFEAFNLRHCFVGYRLLANILYIYIIHIHIHIYIYILYYTYYIHIIIYHIVYNRHYRRGWETVSVRRVGWHPETTRRMQAACTAMHGAFVSAFRLDFGLCISWWAHKKVQRHPCHLFHVFLDPSARHVSRHSYDLR